MRIALLFLFLIFLTSESEAQQHSIKALARVKKDTILLRWAPADPIAWKLCNKAGYKLIREEITKSGDTVTSKSKVLIQKIMPEPLETFEQMALEGNSYAAVVAQALYGKDFIVESPDESVMGIYNQVLEDENRFAFSLYSADMSPEVAKAMGLFYIDTGFDIHKRYIYRIVPLDTAEIFISNGIAVVNPLEILPLPKPMDPRAAFGDKSVELTWNIYYDEGVYIAYLIERSSDGGKNFVPRSNVPFTSTTNKHNIQKRFTTYIDSLESNNEVYHYRIRGINSFGETGPPSEILKGKGTGGMKKIAASIDTIFLEKNGSVQISWLYPQSLKGNLDGYKICMGTNAQGPYQEISKLLPADENNFTIKEPLPVGYYTVKVIGKNGVEVNSLPALFQLPDSLPPMPPMGIYGNIDSTGAVYIDWRPNKEPDIAGYRIFRANSLSEEFVQVTSKPLLMSEYREEIKVDNLTENIYYAVVAVDKRDNPSGFSKPLQLKKPDFIPPSAPVFKKYLSEDGKISFYWHNSTSDDVTGHTLTRISRDDTVVIHFKNNESYYTDIKIINGRNYTYTLFAVDDAGLFSEETELKIQAYKTDIHPAIEKIEGFADRINNEIILTWKYDGEGVNRFVIYRKEGDGKFRFFRNVKGDIFSLNDKMLSINNTYTYRIKAVFDNDDESQLSKPVEVKY